MDALETVFAKHMEKWHPESVTARLAAEVRRLRCEAQMRMVVDSIDAVLASGALVGDALKED